MKSAAPRAASDRNEAPVVGKALGMADNRAVAVAQRQMQAAIGNSPRQVARGQQAAAGAPRRNTTGLPDSLKAGVENLSGYSLDDVQVHYNSAQPAQLQAHAYAQGTDIHVAPGQEQHLPHEAWHVVQQKQGRVKATRQLMAVSINDDTRLEREADAMGKRARQPVAPATAPLRNAAPNAPLVQREVKWKEGYPPDDAFDAFLDSVSDIVEAGAREALTYDALTGADGYTALWQDTAPLLMADRDGEDAEDPAETAVARQFASARYGYAVEAYANVLIPGCQGDLPAGYGITLQGGRGMTRPDIIVTDAGGTEVGWFDITSANSLGHIDKKAGGGWSTKPYVAEIVYLPLDIDSLATSGAAIGVRVAARNAAKRRRAAWQNFVSGKRRAFNNALRRLLPEQEDEVPARGRGARGRGARGRGGRGGAMRGRAPLRSAIPEPTGSVMNKQAQTREAMEEVFPNEDMRPGFVKSMLRAFGLMVAKYGFGAGGSKADGETILRDYHEAELEE